MGEAKRKEIEGQKTVKFDFLGPDISGVNGATPEQRRNGIVNLIVAIVRASYPQGMDRKDGRFWASWQEDILDSEEMKISMPLSRLEWLAKAVDNESLKIDPGLAQGREALSGYLAEAKKAAEPVAS